MSKLIKENWEEKYNLLFVFANTGLEHEKTLDFVNNCDKEFNLGLYWVETVVHQNERIGSSHKIVDYNSASRDAKPFEDVIKKYGIPNKSYPHCTRELKMAPIHSFTKKYFRGEPYKTAIGIRIDEARRVTKQSNANGIIYPLIDTWPSDKTDVNIFWEDHHFTLQIQEHYGNCVTCWKKSDRKLFTIIDEDPWRFDFFMRMELEHGLSGYNAYGTNRVSLDLIDQ